MMRAQADTASQWSYNQSGAPLSAVCCWRPLPSRRSRRAAEFAGSLHRLHQLRMSARALCSEYLHYDDRHRLALTSEDTAHSRKTCSEVKRHVYLLENDARRAVAGRCRHHRRQPSVMGGVPYRCALAVVSLRRQPCIMYMRVGNIYNAQVGPPKEHSPGWQCKQCILV